MLFVPDIHITTKNSAATLEDLRAYTSRRPEDSVIFVGDYVYHFSYDRQALMALYEFMIELCRSGRQVYVLAGNHDRLGSSFVYAEGKTAFDLTQSHINFITKPTRATIEGRNVLLFPHLIDASHLDQTAPTIPTGLDTRTHLIYQEVLQTAAHLIESKNPKEQLSGYLNQALLSELISHPASNPLIVHHHYVAETAIPGQHSRFSYRDIALCPKFTQLDGIQLLSGHLHQPFVLNNRLCIGSFAYNDGSEANQTKILTRLNPDQTLEVERHRLNPQFRIVTDEPLSQDIITKHVMGLLESSKQAMQGARTLSRSPDTTPSLTSSHYTLVRSKLDYDDTASYVHPDIHQAIKSLKLQKTTPNMTALIQQLSDGQKEGLNNSFRAWTDILRDYIAQKYPADKDEYYAMLEESHAGPTWG